MARQLIVSGEPGVLPQTGSNAPVWVNGAAYYVSCYEVNQADYEMGCWKNTDPLTNSWVEQDTAGRPTLISGAFAAAGVPGVSVAVIGNIIHWTIYLHVNPATNNVIYYGRFDTSDDTWDGAFTTNTTPEPDNNAKNYLSNMVARSDGDLVIAYDGETDRIKGADYGRVDYARREGTVWTVDIAAENGGEFSYYGPILSKSPSTDDIQIFVGFVDGVGRTTTVHDRDGTQVGHLSPSNTFTANTASVTYSFPTAENTFFSHKACSWNDGANDRHLVAEAGVETSGGNLLPAYVTGVEDGSNQIASLSQVFTGASDPDIFRESPERPFSQIDADVDLDTGNIWFVLSGGGTNGVDQDIYYLEDTSVPTASTDSWTEHENAVTSELIRARVQDRGSVVVLGYVYEDSGSTYYNEVPISSATPHLPHYPSRTNTLLRM